MTPKPILISITERDAEIILNALAKLPLELSLDTFTSVRAQAQSHFDAMRETPADKPAAKPKKDA